MRSWPVAAWIPAVFLILFGCCQGLYKSDEGEDSNAQDCYYCTTFAFKDLSMIQMASLNATSFSIIGKLQDVPRSDYCRNTFRGIDDGSTNAPKVRRCKDGLCIKMKVTEVNGNEDVFRGCIDSQHIAGDIRGSRCFSDAAGNDTVDVCICESNLCNEATFCKQPPQFAKLLLLLMLVGAAVLLLMLGFNSV